MSGTTISSSVKEARTKHQLTQQQLAEAIGVSRQTVVAIERGNYTPSVSLALKIARHLNQSVETLFTIT